MSAPGRMRRFRKLALAVQNAQSPSNSRWGTYLETVRRRHRTFPDRASGPALLQRVRLREGHSWGSEEYQFWR